MKMKKMQYILSDWFLVPMSPSTSLIRFLFTHESRYCCSAS